MFAPVDNIPALVQMMAWRRPGKKPLYEFTDAYMHYSDWTDADMHTWSFHQITIHGACKDERYQYFTYLPSSSISQYNAH